MTWLVGGVCVVAFLVAAIGTWLNAEGPSPGLGICTLSAPWFAGSLGTSVATIRLREAMTNSRGEKQLLRLAEAHADLELAILLGTVGFLGVLLVLGIGVWRARRYRKRWLHPLASIAALVLAWPLGRSLLAELYVLQRWKGADTMADPDVAVQLLVVLMADMIGIGLAAVLALLSVLIGLVLRMRASRD